MTANKKVTGKASSIPGGLASGGIVSIAITVAGAMGAAWLIGNEKLQENQIGYCSMFILLASSFLGAKTAAAKIKHRILYMSILSGVIYYAVLLAITAIFFGGQYQAMGVTGLLVLAGSACGALISPKGKRGGRKQHIGHRHR